MNKLFHLRIIFLLEIIGKYVTSQTIYTCSPTAPCGCSANSAVLSRIVGGEQAAGQTWGWIASLRYSRSNSHFCGGSIVTDSHILTAAHCTIQLLCPSSVRVYVGSIYLSQNVQVRNVEQIYNHPSYSSSTFANDISILRLSSPLNLDQAGVDLVCLPEVSSIVLAREEYPPPNVNV